MMLFLFRRKIFWLVMAMVCVFQTGFAQSDLNIHGLISQGYLLSSDNNFLANSDSGSTEYNEFIINFQKQLDDKLRVGMQFLSRDLGKAGNNQTKIDWAYGDYQINEKLGVRLGSVKVPFGLYNKFRDIDMLRTTVLLPSTVYMEDYRQYITSFKGGSLYSTLPCHKGDIELEFAYGGSELPDPGIIQDGFKDLNDMLEANYTKGFGVTTGHVGEPDTEGSSRNGYAAKILWNTPIEGFKIGGTRLSLNLDFHEKLVFMPNFAAIAPAPLVAVSPGFQTDVAVNFKPVVDVGSFEYTRDKFTFAGELMAAHTKHSFVVTSAPNLGQNFTNTVSQTRQGAYLQSVYRHNDRHEWSLYRGEYFADRSQKNWLNSQKDSCISFRYNVTPNWALKVENHWMTGVGLAQKNLNPNGFERKWNLIALKSTCNF